MNLFLASGNLTRDPELRYTNSGKPVVSFAIAINEGSGEKRTTEFVECQAWDKVAETVAEYCRKGRKVLITGTYTTDEWIDKKTNQKRTKVIIKCRNVEFLDRRTDEPAPTRPVDESDLADLAF